MQVKRDENLRLASALVPQKPDIEKCLVKTNLPLRNLSSSQVFSSKEKLDEGKAGLLLND